MAPLRINATEYARLEAEAMDRLHVVSRCAFCDWEHSGPAVEGREKATQHRTEAHPDLVLKRRRNTRSLGSFRQKQLREDDWTEIRDERQKRMRLLGID